MKKKFFILFLVSLFVFARPVFADTLFEYYNTGDNDTAAVWGVNWSAQTFLATSTHFISSIKLLLYREGTIGTATISIRSSSGNIPTGADLTSTSKDISTITTSSAGEWINFDFSTPYEITSGVEYAIILKLPSGDVSNKVRWRIVYPTGSYANGNGAVSNDSGVGWESETWDNMFEIYGNLPVEEATTSTTTISGYTGADFQEWLFVNGIIIFFLSFITWGRFFHPIKNLSNDY